MSHPREPRPDPIPCPRCNGHGYLTPEPRRFKCELGYGPPTDEQAKSDLSDLHVIRCNYPKCSFGTIQPKA